MANAKIDESFKLILDYLQTRGHLKPAALLASELAGNANSSNTNGNDKTVSFEDFVQKNAFKKHKLDHIVNDPGSWEAGYESLRTFVENSLDIHRPELLPLLLPIFVHSYLDLVLVNYREAADAFMKRFGDDHRIAHPTLIRTLGAIRLPEHIAESEQALRWRRERFRVRLSERGWGLVLGWLQGGQTVSFDAASTISAKGRDRVLAIVNEHVRIEKFEGAPLQDVSDDEGNLLSAEDDQGEEDSSEVKLGQAPLDPKLEKEVERVMRKEGGAAPELEGGDGKTEQGGEPALKLPFQSELLPYPPTVRTVDILREVEKARETRKRIRLGPEAYSASGTTGISKPSVCLFTIHDAGESLIKLAFSEDCSLIAAAFQDSYIKLWSLKGEALPYLKRDYAPDRVVDRKSFERNVLSSTNTTTIKLVGHSGPVYSLAFDPVKGPSGAPTALLSASQDGTVRLWALNLYTTLAVFRDHREPVWDVTWAPKGIYFATASRDRTARLWSTDKPTALRIFVGHLSDVNCVRFHPNSLYVATGSSDRTCRLWDVQRGACVRIFTGHRGAVTSVAISPSGRLLASASDDLSIILWDLSTGKALRTFKGHEGPIYSLVFSQESSVLLSASADQTVRVWNVRGDGDYELSTLATKKTPVIDLSMTYRNVCLAGGYFQN